MARFLWTYVDTQPGNLTSGAADKTAQNIHFGQSAQALSCRLQKWTHAYIKDQNQLPIQQKSQRALPISNEAVIKELSLHLCSIGKYALCLGVSQPISLATAHHWMKVMGWQWKKEVKGQYVDGCEHSDVVAYCQQVFLPAWTHLYVVEDVNTIAPLSGGEHHIIMWFHDEITFYANNQQKLQWLHQNESAIPQQKGERTSLMVGDCVSADYRWLQSPNGYFTNDDIVAQTRQAMDILSEHYLNKDHVFIFDNVMTHLKHANDALAA
ncbi:hypothetical protein V8B97DRAFT_2024627 [Scleroderma yunnanense]